MSGSRSKPSKHREPALNVYGAQLHCGRWVVVTSEREKGAIWFIRSKGPTDLATAQRYCYEMNRKKFGFTVYEKPGEYRT